MARKRWEFNHDQRKKTVKERFWEKTKRRSNGCIEWLGCKDKDGYGFIRIDGKNVKAHRWVMDMPNSHVLHRCDNPSCVNPDHLFVGSNFANQQDASKKGRHAHQRLCVEDVRRIRDMRKCGARAKDIAKLFEISVGYVYHIQYRKKWAHVD